MIKLAIKSIFENSDKLGAAWKKIDKKECVKFFCLWSTIYIFAKIVKKHEEQIDYLQTEVDGIKSNLA